MAIIVITGTSTGIGQATAIVLGRAGHDVFATMRNPDRSTELQSIAKQEKLPITILPLDVDKDESVSHTINQILTERGRIDVLVNNAGISSLEALEKLELPEFQKIMQTNLFGALRCIKTVLPGMRTRRSGCIVNVSSLCGRIAVPGMTAYCASKYALEGLSEALAGEVKAHNIRIAIVEPGVIETPIFYKDDSPSKDSLYPQPRRQMAAFEASLENHTSPFVVGELIREIIESDNWQLRYPAGPDAAGLLAWRNSLSDEDFIQIYGASDDKEWCDYALSTFGLDMKPFLS